MYSPGRSHCWPRSRLSSPTAAHHSLAERPHGGILGVDGSLYVASSIKVFQMAKSRVPALGVYQLTSVGLSRRTQPGPSFNIRRQCPALPKPGMTVGFKHYQAFLATQVLPLRRLCCPSLSSLGCMEHPRSELIAQTGWCCNQAAKQHLLSLRLYSKVLLDVQRCCCPPKTAVAPAPVHLCRSFCFCPTVIRPLAHAHTTWPALRPRRLRCILPLRRHRPEHIRFPLYRPTGLFQDGPAHIQHIITTFRGFSRAAAAGSTDTWSTSKRY